ncbi:hypothetical protein KA005_40140 [bacterium]|nr:hypothetical protein [bacterium]
MSLLVASVPPARAQFVIAAWEYPDEYGQGIDGMKFWENSTGSWVAAPYYTNLGVFYYVNPSIDDYTYNWTAGAAMKMRVDTVLNSTLTGATDLADGQNYQQHNVTVTHLGIIIFSQQNFTYSFSDDTGAPMYYYEYEVILNFILEYGQIYTVTLTYEIFY